MEVENDQSMFAKPLENFHVDSQVSIPKVNLPENTLFVVNLIKILTSTDGIDIYYEDIAVVGQLLKSKKEYVPGMI